MIITRGRTERHCTIITGEARLRRSLLGGAITGRGAVERLLLGAAVVDIGAGFAFWSRGRGGGALFDFGGKGEVVFVYEVLFGVNFSPNLLWEGTG